MVPTRRQAAAGGPRRACGPGQAGPRPPLARQAQRRMAAMIASTDALMAMATRSTSRRLVASRSPTRTRCCGWSLRCARGVDGNISFPRSRACSALTLDAWSRRATMPPAPGLRQPFGHEIGQAQAPLREVPEAWRRYAARPGRGQAGHEWPRTMAASTPTLSGCCAYAPVGVRFPSATPRGRRRQCGSHTG